MNILKIAGKFLDQPILVAKFKKTVPYILSASGAAYVAHTVEKAKPEERKKVGLHNGITMGATIASALIAPKIANKIFSVKPCTLAKIKKNNTMLIDEYIQGKALDNKHIKILKKAKNKVLSFKEVKTLYENYNPKFLNELIPEPENITSKEIFSEISRLSILGLIPVVGGILGGIGADKVTSSNWRNEVPNKIKEGAYQYLANIFLCNVGAGTALALMEKGKIQSKSQRAFGMIGGIIATGIVGGSALANMIGNKVINPMFGAKTQKNLYDERKPEALDIGLHIDDIATVAVMSGLKWIEPALPIMYAISGYRAGIGYRNVNNCNKKRES